MGSKHKSDKADKAKVDVNTAVPVNKSERKEQKKQEKQVKKQLKEQEKQQKEQLKEQLKEQKKEKKQENNKPNNKPNNKLEKYVVESDDEDVEKLLSELNSLKNVGKTVINKLENVFEKKNTRDSFNDCDCGSK